MRSLRPLTSLASLLVLGSLGVACATVVDDDAGSSEGAATVGVPTGFVMGEMEQTWGASGGGWTFHFKDRAGTTLYSRVSAGNDPLSVEGDKYGPAMNKTPTQVYGWFTNTPWKCVDAEKFAFDKVESTDRDQLCHIEINPTGGLGFSAVVIGLDANGQGLRSWVGSPGARPAPVNGGAVQPVTQGPPRTVNVTMDAATVKTAMVALKQQFGTTGYNKVSNEVRNDCLKNARTSVAGWLDIQSHYYCLLPYSQVRECYSTKLVEEATAGGQRAAIAPVTAYNACIAAPNATPEAKWLHANQEAVFKYVMFTRQGAGDFALESENEAINGYYQAINETRPRRVNDTFPAWLPDQPRYEAIRKLQVAAQQGATTPASGRTDGGT